MTEEGGWKKPTGQSGGPLAYKTILNGTYRYNVGYFPTIKTIREKRMSTRVKMTQNNKVTKVVMDRAN